MYDENLTPLLESCSNEDLDPLVNFILEPRSSLLAKDPDYIRHYRIGYAILSGAGL